ncbi:zinc ribbon domain-containing protein [Dissulfurirhabdus thermomarina]|uniref:Zinc ribbon domain-containing protein n=1 Tax=Dissulfurirhabdus thermomarina TaxID=1765737 RepID=A0A6N9TJV8_DISTH|nr:zinc ribbon domain-containing protein [Dissulfurirhabdus thermomarina]NDY41369.1 zinc ribbon domain-containing protein [Dissulfurirhabdus thermomarina]NMX23615.1 zinc ribbon domain-containing protein [Dissulfurirhabdus thermomarina]
MPIYEYECRKCHKVTEHWQRISDPPLETCEACGGTLTKLISHSSFHLKGSGWYVTDYAGKKSGSSAQAEGGSKSEAKSATKSGASSSDDA